MDGWLTPGVRFDSLSGGGLLIPVGDYEKSHTDTSTEPPARAVYY